MMNVHSHVFDVIIEKWESMYLYKKLISFLFKKKFSKCNSFINKLSAEEGKYKLIRGVTHSSKCCHRVEEMTSKCRVNADKKWVNAINTAIV